VIHSCTHPQSPRRNSNCIKYQTWPDLEFLHRLLANSSIILNHPICLLLAIHCLIKGVSAHRVELSLLVILSSIGKPTIPLPNTIHCTLIARQQITDTFQLEYELVYLSATEYAN
jgi:hypothetical protein